MSNSRFTKSLLFKIGLSIAAIAITVIFIEFAGRYLFSKECDSNRSTTLDLIENVSERNEMSGNKLRMTAWSTSFTQRGLDVPETGPRDGKNGQRITPNRCMVTDCTHLSAIPGIIEIDESGFQYAGNKEEASPDILIIGGSVAWGTGASNIENTYFDKLYNMLKANYPEIGITILAGARSTSGKDVYAFVDKGLDKKPDMVLFLNGLNDITVQEPVIKRAGDYLLNMRTTIKIAELDEIDMVIIRQPYPGNKTLKTELERRVLELSHKDYENTLAPLYKYIGTGLG